MNTRTGYAHSEIFSLLKGTNERLSHNFSSSQYLSTLDFFIYNAIKGLVEETKWVDIWVAKVLAWSQVNFRRKVSHVDKKDLPAKVMAFLIAPDEHRFEALKAIRFDRTVLREMVLVFLSSTEPVLLRENLSPYALNKLHIKVAYHGDNLFGLRAEVLHWFDQFNQLKSMILEKYTRHVINSARSTYVASGHTLNLDDVIQDFMLTAIKAAERCDPLSGTLTSFIDNWLVSARHAAFSKVKEHNKMVSLEFIPEKSSESGEPKSLDLDWIRFLARKVDPTGIARFSFGLEESLSASDKTFLRLFATGKH